MTLKIYEEKSNSIDLCSQQILFVSPLALFILFFVFSFHLFYKVFHGMVGVTVAVYSQHENRPNPGTPMFSNRSYLGRLTLVDWHLVKL